MSRRAELHVRQLAYRAIREQSAYYASRESQALADRWEQTANASLKSLQAFPERGAPCRLEAQVLKDLRRIGIPRFPYSIFYRYSSRRNRVEVLHVLHDSRDSLPLLREALIQ